MPIPDYVIFYSTDAQTGAVTETRHYLTEEEKAEYAKVQVPQSVTRGQARKALAIQGLFNLVQPAIDSIQDPLQRQLAQIDWDDSLTYERNNTTLAMLAAGLGLTEQQLDDLFILAAQQP